MTEDNKQNEHKEEIKKPQDHSGVMMTGHIKIFDPETHSETIPMHFLVFQGSGSCKCCEALSYDGA